MSIASSAVAPLYELPLATRRARYESIHKKFPKRVPILVKYELDKSIEVLGEPKYKFIVNPGLTGTQFAHIIRHRLKLPPTQGLFYFVQNTIMTGSTTIGELAAKYSSEDGFLYVTVRNENAFG